MPLASESPQTPQTAGGRLTPVPPGANAQPQAPVKTRYRQCNRSLRVEYAELGNRKDIQFLFSLFWAYMHLEYVHIHVTLAIISIVTSDPITLGLGLILPRIQSGQTAGGRPTSVPLGAGAQPQAPV